MVGYTVLKEAITHPAAKFEIRMIKRPPDAPSSILGDYLNGLSIADRRRVFKRILGTAIVGPQRNPERYGDLGDGIYEIKSGQHRIPFFYAGKGIIVLTHGFFKTTQKAPPREISRARQLRDLYIRRFGE